jgi:cohesin loading factor subunit SCC2
MSFQPDRSQLTANLVQLKDAEAIVEPALDASFRCGRLIISFLIGRAGKAPKNSTASEVEYKAVLDHLIKDLLLVLDLPEWPIAAGMLRIAIKSMVSGAASPCSLFDSC